MFKRKNHKIIKTFKANEKTLPELLEYTRSYFEGKKLNTQLTDEYELLVEEVSLKLIDNASRGASITVESSGLENDVYLKLKCPGKPVVLQKESAEDFGGMLIEEYQDHLKQSYGSGVNSIVFAVSSDSLDMLKYSVTAFAISIILAAIIIAFCSKSQISFLANNVIAPINNIYITCLKSLATPMIFFSIAAVITKLWLKFENNGRLIKLFLKYLATSIIAALAGYLVITIAKNYYLFYDYSQYIIDEENLAIDSFEMFIGQFTMSTITSPFEISNPIPLIILAIITGVAASTIFGKRGSAIRNSISSLSSLFEKMFNIVYKVIPLFLIFALLLNWLNSILLTINTMLEILILYFAGALIMFVVYAIQLGLAGVNPITFIKDYKDVIWENLKIGSNINAYPYNKRVLGKRVHLSHKDLSEELKLGTMVNMDGCCMVIAAYSFYVVYSMNLT